MHGTHRPAPRYRVLLTDKLNGMILHVIMPVYCERFVKTA